MCTLGGFCNKSFPTEQGHDTFSCLTEIANAKVARMKEGEFLRVNTSSEKREIFGEVASIFDGQEVIFGPVYFHMKDRTHTGAVFFFREVSFPESRVIGPILHEFVEILAQQCSRVHAVENRMARFFPESWAPGEGESGL